MENTPTKAKYDWPRIHHLRTLRVPWSELALQYGVGRSTIMGAYSRWRRGLVGQPPKPKTLAEVFAAQDARATDEQLDAQAAEGSGKVVDKLVTAEELKRITSLEDLLELFKVDTTVWQVGGYRVNVWEQHSVAKGIVPLYQVRAWLKPSELREAKLAAELYAQAKADMQAGAPSVLPVDRDERTDRREPVLAVVAVKDPHIGMLAWGEEVGHNYDSKIAVRDYGRAIRELAEHCRRYPVKKILYHVGDDLMHVDGFAEGARRGGATAGGTPQDIDSRVAKIFTTARRAVVEAIDGLRQIAPVDVLVVPGNHDEQTSYKLGEVLAAWYRNDPEVHVIYNPLKRKFYGWGQNVFMVTHGEDYARQRDSLPLIFATECPPDLWVKGSRCREIHTGHNHILKEGKYYPTSEADETRAVRTRSLPGLTPEDSWHYAEGYRHRRTATLLLYRESGGIAGLHEVNP